ncbi:MAG TPA: HAMP domain-containing sensor histidine kinase, partial [Candidatus Limnocylindrales bacterium]|nr:HAMP domain-containing sensor histidine kinase [Candidatus Limnocylindrales bacterium]
MSLPGANAVQAGARRVALAAAGIVAILYVLIAVAVVLIVNHNLTAGIDSRLSQALKYETAQRPPGPEGVGAPPGGPQFAAPVICWRVRPDGTVFGCPGNNGASVPTSYATISQPTTIEVAGTDVRVAGTRADDGDAVIVGQSMDSVYQARSTLVLAEAVIGPVLLLIVFLGALAIGQRVAGPVERARQRQMAFTANASHELRTPLSVIQAQAAIALAHPRDEQWYRQAFVRVDEESKRMKTMVEDLLWLARFDATHGAARAQPVDVGVLAQQAADRFAAVAEARHQRLSLKLAEGAFVIAASPEWLDHLMGVLLDNACKYTPDGGSVEVRVWAEGSRVCLAVDDSGAGIAPEDRARIFERFHRATDQAGGAGLGLAIADAVVRATNGRWAIGTSAAGGASMAVSWPRLLAPAGVTSVTAP